jgi:hypothetical protein
LAGEDVIKEKKRTPLTTKCFTGITLIGWENVVAKSEPFIRNT